MRYLFVLTVFMFIVSCNNHRLNNTKTDTYVLNDTIAKELSFYTDENNRDLLALNNNAIKVLQNIDRVSDIKTRDSLLNMAMSDINKAIQQDSNFFNAYLNKAALLRKMGNYDESILSLQELLKRKSYPEAIFVLGITYEKLGDLKLAKKNYIEAYEKYEEYLKTPLAIAQDEINQQFLLIFIEGKETALDKINEELKDRPNDSELLINKSIIEEFNRQEFISSF